MNLELEVVQPIYIHRISMFGHVGWLDIEDVDIFHQDVSGFSCTEVMNIGHIWGLALKMWMFIFMHLNNKFWACQTSKMWIFWKKWNVIFFFFGVWLFCKNCKIAGVILHNQHAQNSSIDFPHFIFNLMFSVKIFK